MKTTWTGADGNTSFTDAGNWSGGAVPTSADDAIIGAGVTVDLTGHSAQDVDSVTLDANALLDAAGVNLTLEDTASASLIKGTLQVSDEGGNATLFAGGTISGTGDVSVLGPGALLLTNSDTLTLVGLGTIALGGGVFGGRVATGGGPGTYDTVLNVNDLIEGTGIVGASSPFSDQLRLINEGGIDANGLGRLQLRDSIVNDSLMQATGGGTLYLGAGTFVDNALGGIRDGASTATVTLDHVRIEGGQLAAVSGATFDVATGTTLDGAAASVTLTGAMSLEAGATLTLVGTITGGGTIDASQGIVDLVDADISGITILGDPTHIRTLADGATPVPVGSETGANISRAALPWAAGIGGGGFVVAYSANQQIAYRLFDASGYPVSGELYAGPQGDTQPDDSGSQFVAGLSDGRFLIAWDESSTETQHAEVFNPDGSVSIPAFEVGDVTGALGLSFAVTAMPGGGFAIGRTEGIPPGGQTNSPVIQVYDASGNKVGGEQVITQPPYTAGPANAQGTTFQGYFAIAGLTTGQVVTAWQGFVAGDGDGDFSGAHAIGYSLDGTVHYLTDLTFTENNGEGYFYPEAAALPNGAFVITWLQADSNEAFPALDVAGSVIDAQGGRHDFLIPTGNTQFYSTPPTVTVLPNGNFVVAFNPTSEGNSGGRLTLAGYEVDEQGNPVGTVFPITTGAAQWAKLATLSSGNFVAAYADASETNVLTREFSVASPAVLAPAGGFNINTAAANSPQVAKLSGGGFVATYQGNDGAVYAQIYDAQKHAVGSEIKLAASGSQPVVAAQPDDTQFMVAWTTGTEVDATMLNENGSVAVPAFTAAAAVADTTYSQPALSVTTGFYSLAYAALDTVAGTELTQAQTYDEAGATFGPPEIFPGSDGQFLGSPHETAFSNLFMVMLSGTTSFGEPTQFLDFGAYPKPSPSPSPSVAAAALANTVPLVPISPSGDGAERIDGAIAALTDGNAAVAWNELGPEDTTWHIETEVVTSGGTIVSTPLAIPTLVPRNATPDAPALTALPGGGFVVTFDGGSGLEAQQFDADGVAGGPVFAVGEAGDAHPASTLLADGTLLELSDNGSGTVTAQEFVACFAAGTRILTAAGEMPVETLRDGEKIVSLTHRRPVALRWLGWQRSRVPPVRVAAGALGAGVPHRDLRLSPDHAVFVDGALIPVRYLVNGSTIAQEAAGTVAYFHVELPAHGVVVAEGLLCESYLDTGNRAAFEGGGLCPLDPYQRQSLWNPLPSAV